MLKQPSIVVEAIDITSQNKTTGLSTGGGYYTAETKKCKVIGNNVVISERHLGAANVLFLDGHVTTPAKPFETLAGTNTLIAQHFRIKAN